MDEYQVTFTRQAREQLRAISHYIADDLREPETAQKWLGRMEKRIQSLSAFPKRTALTKEEPWHSQGVHMLVEGNYYIYYWIDEVRKRVKVTAVIYARREQRQQLSNMEWE